MRKILAVDLGASSGRVMLGTYDGHDLTCTEIHRFENKPQMKDGCLRWDYSALLQEIRCGIAKVPERDSIGVDTWGVDFGLLDENGVLLEDPVHYRDQRTVGVPERIFAEKMDAATLYAHTGTQIMASNTAFQLAALKQQRPELLERAKTLLFIPELFVYALCGEICCEQTDAGTAQLLNLRTGAWDGEVLEAFGIPEKLLKTPQRCGRVLSQLPEGGKVISIAGHDTQCASAAMPTQDSEHAAFVSCGTWSLLGTELDAPILTEQSRLFGLSNELGANGKINYLKNIVGLWLVQESRRQWIREGTTYSFAELAALAQQAAPLQCFIDVDDPSFNQPGDMPARIRTYCEKTGQYVPQTVGQIVRCIYESLALKYRFALDQISQITGKRLDVLHILGGGAQAKLLCEMTANCIGRKVIAGPSEATALGNMLLQLIALGDLPDLDAGRKLIARTQPLDTYLPSDPESWDAAYDRFLKLL